MATLLVVRSYEKTFCANKRKAIKKSDKYWKYSSSVKEEHDACKSVDSN